MAGQPKPNPLAAFQRLNDSVYLYDPSTATAPASADLVILCSWMDAAPKHIAKYVEGYVRLRPRARILLIRNEMPDMLVRSTSTARKQLAPALDVVRGAARPDAGAHVVLHLFSNGGARRATHLAAWFREAEGAALPIDAMLLDSSPGKPSYRRSLNALSVGLPKSPVLWLLGRVVAQFFLLAFRAVHFLTRRPIMITEAREQLLDKSLFNPKAPRCYLYSKADDMVGWEDVEEHVREAEERGFAVQTVCFEKSPHAGHIMEDPEKYWAAVQDVLPEQ
ncbi:hypothetical protein BDY21DRAFT_332800 [Lineolata rhizophorae]|uniref:Indole-diterpene biosynthesis protein PaxU n=1 Tax=Lineolata rhizophorae TaxID=578093 RepID=A0A6A6PCJ0_9PEZI|nr:hypothetical protein BDY21DRAFT_332800 [Lineolata rhizophorae]